MARFKTTCPKCHARYTVDEANLGRRAKCPKCGAMFRISKPTGDAAKASGSAPASAATRQHEVTQAETPPPKAPSDQTIADAVPSSAPQEAVAVRASEADVPLEWSVGDLILDTYEVKDIHHGGGMGLVYRVHHRNWNMDLAVKSPRANYFQTEEQKANFVHECETWINLGLHPNIVSCYYVRMLGSVPRVFAEYVEGGSLKDWINDGRLYQGSPQEALKWILDIAIQFAWGLHYAHEHEQHLIHRDVKPDNVMMTPEGTPKVTDFGLAKARAALGESPSGGAGQGVAVSRGGMTPAYCSPEQANKETLTRKTDIWSWAVSVLEMFTGEVTWASGTVAAEALETYLKAGPEDETIPKMPEGLAGLLRRCLEERPDERPRDMAEIAATLKGAYRQTTGEDYPREEPKAAELLADGLNNRGTSALDLGKKGEAERLFDSAIQVDPHHPEATYNRGLLLWRTGRMIDVKLVEQMQEVCLSHSGDWRAKYLLGLVHVERGDAESAVEQFEAAVELASGAGEAQSALRMATADVGHWGQCVGLLQGHKAPVSSIALASDGRALLSGSEDYTLRLWDLTGSGCVRVFEGHAGKVNSVSLSHDGRLALSGSRDDKTLRLWDVTSANCLRVIDTGHVIQDELQVSLSSDGRLALMAGDRLVLWDTGTGRVVRSFGERAYRLCAAISPDSSMAISNGAVGVVEVWDLATGKLLRSFGEHPSTIYSAVFSSDGRWVLSGGAWIRTDKPDSANRGKTLLLWEVSSGKVICRFDSNDAVCAVSISSDGRFVLSGHQGGVLRIWEAQSGKCLRTFEPLVPQPKQEMPLGVRCVAIAPDGSFALSAYRGAFHGPAHEDSTSVQRWRFATGGLQESVICRPRSVSELRERSHRAEHLKSEAEAALEAGDGPGAYQAAHLARSVPGYSRAPQLLSVMSRAGGYGRIRCLNAAWKVCDLLGHQGPVGSLQFSRDGRFLISSGGDQFTRSNLDNTVRFWDLHKQECLQVLEGHRAAVSRVSLLPDGCRALSSSRDKTVRLWDLAAGKCLHTFEWHSDGVTALAVSPDGRFVLSAGGKDKPILLWEPAIDKCWRKLSGHTGAVSAIAISPDGRFALSSGSASDPAIRLWDLAAGSCLRRLEGHSKTVLSVAFSPDGRSALSGSSDIVALSPKEPGSILRWVIGSGQCLGALKEHWEASFLSFFPDGHHVLSAGSKLRLWDVTSRECVWSFEGHKDWVISCAVSHDGCFAASGSRDKSLSLWRLDWDYEFPESADWDEGARPYLETFLTLHCPYGDDGLSRAGKPIWSDEDFNQLLRELQYRGYGWLRPEGVRKKLEEMTANWQGPPPLPWESQNTS